MAGKQEYSLAHLTSLCPPPELIYMAAMTGCDYVGLRPIYMGLPGEPNYDLAHLPELLRDTETALRETGIGLHDIELARITDGCDIKLYAPAMEVAAELGAKCVLSSIWTNDKAYYTDTFGQLCDQAAEFGLTVDLEFVTWAGVRSLAEAKEVLESVNRPNMGLMVDTLHFYRSRVALEELDACPRQWFHFVHLCDCPEFIPSDKESLIHTGRDERLYVGEGAVDIAAIVSRLPHVVYAIELPHLERVARLGKAEHIRRCLSTAKQYFRSHAHQKRQSR